MAATQYELMQRFDLRMPRYSPQMMAAVQGHMAEHPIASHRELYPTQGALTAHFERLHVRTKQYIDAVQQGWSIDDAVLDFTDDEQ
ncbi:hypothetical protein A2U01_0067991 [Trifolium medium]|uniref:Uncharacterized protein n=1 Tax=Trifolium medium TaxID=97028 RepID=A0A392SFL2_9FABA|nr:hypothetical protein [Trifolium medium]